MRRLFGPIALFKLFSPPYLKLYYRLLKDRRVPFLTKLIPLGGLAYVIWPVDLLPDWLVPIFSYMDDFLILILAFHFFVRLAPPQIVAEHMVNIMHENAPGGM